MNTVICSVDRIVGDVIVLISDDNEKFELSKKSYDLKENDVVELLIEKGSIRSVKPLPDETERKLERNRARLHSLFERKRKK